MKYSKCVFKEMKQRKVYFCELFIIEIIRYQQHNNLSCVTSSRQMKANLGYTMEKGTVTK